jgi:hypothetical protein
VAVVAALVALGYFAATRPSRIERDLERIANKYGLERVHPDMQHFVGNGIPIEESRKLEAEIEQLAKDHRLDGGGWSSEDAANSHFTAPDAGDKDVRLSFYWHREVYTSIELEKDRRTPLQAFTDWLKNLAP